MPHLELAKSRLARRAGDSRLSNTPYTAGPDILTVPHAANMAERHDDLHAEQTEGFKVGEKKTLDEYQNLGM